MKKLSILGCALLMSGCQTLQQVNDGLATVNSVLETGNTSISSTGNSSLSSKAHQASIENALANTDTNNDKDLETAIAEAAPNIKGFLRTESCLKSYDGSRLNRYAAPGVVFPSFNYLRAPLPQMRYHNDRSCAHIKDLSGWGMLAKNAVAFNVVYISHISDEAVSVSHRMVKQRNGDWLFIK